MHDYEEHERLDALCFQCFEAGLGRVETIQALRDQGVEPIAAEQATKRFFDRREEWAEERRQREIKWSIFAIIGGFVLTFITYARAASSGGYYVIAWGPMVFGVVSLTRALQR